MIGSEEMYDDILITRTKRKPPHWMLERADASGQPLSGMLEKQPKGRRGWNLYVEGGGLHSFKTRRAALDWFGRLERIDGVIVLLDNCKTM